MPSIVPSFPAIASGYLKDESIDSSGGRPTGPYISCVTQFQKQYQEFPLLEPLSQASTATTHLHNSEENSVDIEDKTVELEETRLAGISGHEFKSLTSAFEKFFQTQVTPCLNNNPLTNDVVLREIMKYLSAKDLCQMRLVNRTMNDRSSACLKRRTRQVRLETETDFTRFCMDKKMSDRFPITSLRIKMKSFPVESRTSDRNEHLPVKALRSYWNTAKIPDYENKLKTTFQNTSGLKTLRLDFPDPLDRKHFLFNAEELKQFKLVTLESFTFNWKAGAMYSVEFLRSLFELMPNVKCLNIVWMGGDEDDVKPLGMAIDKLHLQTFTCNAGREAPARLLTQLSKQKLQTIDVEILAHNDSEAREYTEFFRSQSDSLQNLVIKVYRDTLPVKIQLPVMTKLENLSFSSDQNNMEVWPMSPVHPNQVPNLRKLDFCLDGMDAFFQESVFSRVSDICIHRLKSAQNLSRLPSFFPLKKLKNVDSGFDLSELPALFHHFKDLEQLELLINDSGEQKQNINSILSGISPESELIPNQLLATNSEDLIAIVPTGPSLQNMKRLTELSIKIVGHGNIKTISEINDIGVQLGFLRMQRLSRLTISGDFFISVENVIKLNEHHANVILNPNYLAEQSFPATGSFESQICWK